MNFELTKQQEMSRTTLRRFAETEVKPLAAEIDATHRFPTETVEKMAKLGIMGIPFPKEYGGAGGDYLTYSIAVEELSKVCATTGVIVSAHTSLCINPIYQFGTPEQKAKYLPDLCSGRKLGAFGLTEPNAGTDAAGQNVEKVAEALIVLEGLKNNTTPTEIVAVLNKPASMSLAGKSLTKLQEELATGIYNETNNFIMTNSTYKGDDIVNTFATKITSANFIEDKPDATLAADKVVNIYVERLAAKVKVAVDADNEDLANTDEISLGEYTIKTGTNAQVTKELKIKIVGWGLNATTNDSYLVKSIDATNWTDDKFTAFNWNDANNHRSYWAKSTNYGNADAVYPSSFSDAIDAEGSNVVTGTDKTDANQATLNYVSWNELGQILNKSLYCMENTNTKEILAPSYYSAATQVVVAAQTTEETDLIRYNKTLYTEAGFMARILNELHLDIYKLEGVSYKGIDVEDLAVKNIYDGKVTIEKMEIVKFYFHFNFYVLISHFF